MLNFSSTQFIFLLCAIPTILCLIWVLISSFLEDFSFVRKFKKEKTDFVCAWPGFEAENIEELRNKIQVYAEDQRFKFGYGDFSVVLRVVERGHKTIKAPACEENFILLKAVKRAEMDLSKLELNNKEKMPEIEKELGNI